MNNVYFVMLLEGLPLEAKHGMYFGCDVIYFNGCLSFCIFVPRTRMVVACCVLRFKIFPP